jgi:hypothetical protein
MVFQAPLFSPIYSSCVPIPDALGHWVQQHPRDPANNQIPQIPEVLNDPFMPVTHITTPIQPPQEYHDDEAYVTVLAFNDMDRTMVSSQPRLRILIDTQKQAYNDPVSDYIRGR